MSFQPSSTLRSRTFIGLLVAQFLAAFNDQAIHAAAMFFAISKKSMTEAQAIALMPILFYAPWAIFATIAGYLADRYSKRTALVFWKVAEILITAVALVGFWLGGGGLRVLGEPWAAWAPRFEPLGPWLVLSTVFLMGMHSAFFVPAKYGVMPEILQQHLLSKGNGFLESSSFIGVILGTVCGGVLSSVWRGEEYKIGLLLVGLALVGSVASLLIQRMPPANPTRPFPVNLSAWPLPWVLRILFAPVLVVLDLFWPLVRNISHMLRSQPLALAVVGIAFFTFIVAFMRATVYMHGESQVPRWDELKISVVVGMVAVGIGVGSPLAGWLSGGKVELALIPLGALGMIAATAGAAYVLSDVPWLIGLIIGIGFFTGFYLVPLFALLQQRAPKASKGDFVATSNLINVTGAIFASVLFFLLVRAAERLQLVQELEQKQVATGVLESFVYDDHGHPESLKVVGRDGATFRERAVRGQVEIDDINLKVTEGSPVVVTSYQLGSATHFKVRRADWKLEPVYDMEHLPRYLFFGAALMTALTLLILTQRLPDILGRMLLWLRSLGRLSVRVLGATRLPGDGAVLLVTNCRRREGCMEVLAATDRYTRLVMPADAAEDQLPVGLWLLSLRFRLGTLRVEPGSPAWDRLLDRVVRSLRSGEVVGLPAGAERFYSELRQRIDVRVVPVFCDLDQVLEEPGRRRREVRVVIGEPLAEAPAYAVLQHELERLEREAIQLRDENGAANGSLTAAQGTAANGMGER